MEAAFFRLGILLALVVGAMLGSFATAISYRIPENRSWAFPSRRAGEKAMPRSACPHCGATLKFFDLIPLLSWLMLKGHCRYCRAPISPAYPLTELFTAASCAAVYICWGWTLHTCVLMLAVPFMVAMGLIDMRHFILPDVLNLILACLWPVFLLAGVLQGGPMPSLGILVGGLTGAALYALLAYGLGRLMKKILKKDALGFGDVKFFAVAGLWLGVVALPYFLILAGVAGVAIGFVYRLVTKQPYFPFGPALIGAFYLCLLAAGLHLPLLI